MSRLLVLFLLGGTGAVAQSTSNEEIAGQIEKARRLVAVDEEGCIRYPQNDEIVVCGENPDNKSQRVFRERGEPEEYQRQRGEAVSTKRAAACLPADSMCKIHLKMVGIGFGYVPPPAIPLEEVLKGLPEPDMVVPEGSNPE